MVYNQLESVWPVHGSVLIHNDEVWACAGRNSYLDGGMHLHRLDPRTGEELGHTLISSLDENDEQKPIIHQKEIFFAASLDNETPSGRKCKRAGSAKDLLWSTPGDIQARAMVLARYQGKKCLVVAGAKGDWIMSQQAYQGEKGTVLRVLAAEDGNILLEQPLSAPPIFDSMAAARNCLYLALDNGTLLCLEKNGALRSQLH